MRSKHSIKPSILLFVTAFSLMVGLICLVNSGYAERESIVPGRVLIKLKPGTPETLLSSVLSSPEVKVIGEIEKLNVKILAVPPGEEEAWIKRLEAEPFIEYAEYDRRVKALFTPNDYYWDFQWNMVKIKAHKAWDVTTGSPDVIIAIIDTGVDLDHPEFLGKIVPGKNFITPALPPDDDHGHGTHVAGIAAALGNNGQGVAGVAWGAKIMPLKVLDAEGNGKDSDVAAAIIYAVEHNAKVLNMSLGGYGSTQTLADAVAYAYNKGCLLVAATGNDGKNEVMYPAAYPEVIAVAATNKYNGVTWYSNYGPEVEVAAPGGGGSNWIISTYRGGGYAYSSGTSMATPHVAGLGALIWSMRPDLSNVQVRNLITSSAMDLSPAGWDEYSGYGLIDVTSSLPPTLEVRPLGITVLVDENGHFYPDNREKLRISNSAYRPLQWKAGISSPSPWLEFSPDSGITYHGVDSLMSITFTLPSTYGLYTVDMIITGTAPEVPDITETIEFKLVYVDKVYPVFLPIVTSQGSNPF